MQDRSNTLHCKQECWPILLHDTPEIEYRQFLYNFRSTSYEQSFVLGMWWSQLKSVSVRFGHCVSNPSDADLPRDHSSFCWTAIYRCMHISNTKSDDISRSHLTFNIIQTSRNSYSGCNSLLLRGKRRTETSDEWELYAMNSRSEFHVNESVNPSDFGFALNCRIPTTFEFGFELRHTPCLYDILSHHAVLSVIYAMLDLKFICPSEIAQIWHGTTKCNANVWNSLPDAIRRNSSQATFKHSLKTHFYTQCFH